MILYANGCSMTYGAEIDETIRASVCWPAVLASSLGMECINDAIGGASNDRILRTTTQFVTNYLVQGKNPNDLFVAIGWTNPVRRELGWASAEQKDHTEFFFNILPNYSPPNPDVRRVSETIFGECSSVRESEIRYYVQILAIQNLLDVHGIKYVFCKGLPSSNNFDEKFLYEIEPMRNMIKKNNFFGYDNNYHFHYDTVSKNLPRASGGHPLAEGHSEWANLIYSHIKDKNLL